MLFTYNYLNRILVVCPKLKIKSKYIGILIYILEKLYYIDTALEFESFID